MPLPPKRHASRSPDGERAAKRTATSSPEEGELDDLSPPQDPSTPTPTSSGPQGHHHISISLPSKPNAPTLSSSSATLLSAGPSSAKPRSVPFPFKKKTLEINPPNGNNIQVLPPLSILDPGPDPVPLMTDSKRYRRPGNNAPVGRDWDSNYSNGDRYYPSSRDYHSKAPYGRRDRDVNTSWRDRDRDGGDKERSWERDDRDRDDRDYGRDRDYDRDRDSGQRSLSPSGPRSPSPSYNKHRLPAPRTPPPAFSPLSSSRSRHNYRDDYRDRDGGRDRDRDRDRDRGRDYNRWDRGRGRDKDDRGRGAGYDRYVPESPVDSYRPSQGNWRNRRDHSPDVRGGRSDEHHASQYALQSPSPRRPQRTLSPTPPPAPPSEPPSTTSEALQPLVSPPPAEPRPPSASPPPAPPPDARLLSKPFPPPPSTLVDSKTSGIPVQHAPVSIPIKRPGAPLPSRERTPPSMNLPAPKPAVLEKEREGQVKERESRQLLLPVIPQGQGNSAAPPPPPQRMPLRKIMRPAPKRRTRKEEQEIYGKEFVGCGEQSDYEVLTKLGEGTFGEVHKALHKQTGTAVALKRILMHNEKEGMPVTALREIKILKALKHPCIVNLLDMFVVRSTEKDPLSVYMVFPYMDHDLAGLLENERVKLQPSHIKLYMKQLLEGTEYMHRNHILHRDMKAANLLISNNGSLRIADFGLARSYDYNIGKADARGNLRKYTNCVVTRWYRPPELLLGARQYGGEVDIWGIGCVLGEMFTRRPILPGTSDLDQLDKIWQLCGTPNQHSWPNYDKLPGCDGITRFEPQHPRRVKQAYESVGPETSDLLDKLLTCNPKERISASQALDHEYFWTDPLPADPKTLPIYEPSHEFDKRGHRNQHHPLPGAIVVPQHLPQQQPPHDMHPRFPPPTMNPPIHFGRGLPPPEAFPQQRGHHYPPGPPPHNMAPRSNMPPPPGYPPQAYVPPPHGYPPPGQGPYPPRHGVPPGYGGRGGYRGGPGGGPGYGQGGRQHDRWDGPGRGPPRHQPPNLPPGLPPRPSAPLGVPGPPGGGDGYRRNIPPPGRNNDRGGGGGGGGGGVGDRERGNGGDVLNYD